MEMGMQYDNFEPSKQSKRKMNKPKTGMGAPPPIGSLKPKPKKRGSIQYWLSMLKGRAGQWGWRQYNTATTASAIQTYINKNEGFEATTRSNRVYVRFTGEKKVVKKPVRQAAPEVIKDPVTKLEAYPIKDAPVEVPPVEILKINKVTETPPRVYLRKSNDAQHLNALACEVEKLRKENLELKLRRML